MTVESRIAGFGLAGVLFGILSIAIALFQDDLRPKEPSATEQIKTSLLEKGKDMLGIGEDKKPAPVAVAAKYDYVKFAYMGGGLLAFILGVTSYLRQENHRVSGMAGALGIIAMAWQYVLIAVVVAVVIFLLANLDI